MGIYGSEFIPKSRRYNPVKEYTEEDFTGEFVCEFSSEVLNNFLNEDYDQELYNLGLEIFKEAANNGKEIVKNKAEFDKKVKQSSEELTKVIKKDGLNKKSISNIMDKFWKGFAVELDKMVIEDILKKDKNFTAAKVTKSIILFLSCVLCNTLLMNILQHLFGVSTGSAITAAAVGPLIEENAKQIAVKGDFANCFVTVFNILEFSQYAMNLTKSGFTLKGILAIRLPAVAMHFTTMAIQKLTNNAKIYKGLSLDKASEEEKKKKIAFIGHLIGIIIHAAFNTLQVIYGNEIIRKVGNAGGHKQYTGDQIVAGNEYLSKITKGMRPKEYKATIQKLQGL